MWFLDDIITLIDDSIKEDAENLITAWNIIKDGFNSEIDADRKIISESHNWIAEYQKKLIDETGISNLKIKFTNNSGYFIEVSKQQIAKVPDCFIQIQTLTQAARYKTEELQYFEEKLLWASREMSEKEYNLFLWIRDNVLKHFDNIYSISRKIASIDFCSNWAHISLNKSYTTPEVSPAYDTSIIWGKHPVILEIEPDFISNDMILSRKDFVHIITWPNMWWKSTYLRQNALLILMAHIGYDIPCTRAKIGLTDKIFSRVWSWDNLYLWQSTFMVEMQEISYILRNSTKNSFVIIDEIGRGTSTYDGMSLAWAILEYNHNTIGAKTLFATHYHEIIDHAEDLKYAHNYSVAVWENNESIVFLRKIIPGGIKKSYGLEVAKLAWMPREVISGARDMLKSLQSCQNSEQLTFFSQDIPSGDSDITYKDEFQDLSSSISEIDVDNITPLQSLEKLIFLQKKLQNLEKNLNNKK